jgi:hypothetical protein
VGNEKRRNRIKGRATRKEETGKGNKEKISREGGQ